MLLFTLVYFTSYVTRINYAAIISEIIRSEGYLIHCLLALTAAQRTESGRYSVAIWATKYSPKQ